MFRLDAIVLDWAECDVGEWGMVNGRMSIGRIVGVEIVEVLIEVIGVGVNSSRDGDLVL